MTTINERFVSRHIVNEAGCWVWQGGLVKGGYAQLSINGSRQYAHRVAYEMYKGKIPDHLEIDHKCRVRNCVNPEHLEAVSHQENMKRSTAGKPNRVKTHCPAGHPYSGQNLYIQPSNNSRICRICMKKSGRKFYWANKKERVVKDQCKRGHSLSGENLYIIPTTKSRTCKICRKEWQRRFRAKKH